MRAEIPSKLDPCPHEQIHGNPFRYCDWEGCGWMEADETPDPPRTIPVDHPALLAAVEAMRVLIEAFEYHNGDNWPETADTRAALADLRAVMEGKP